MDAELICNGVCPDMEWIVAPCSMWLTMVFINHMICCFDLAESLTIIFIKHFAWKVNDVNFEGLLKTRTSAESRTFKTCV